MPDENRESHFRVLETLKAFATPISSVILAFVGIVLTNQYNTGQLEIARIKEISALVPKLATKDSNERKLTAIALGLYGKDAIPALMALLDDADDQVRLASVHSLELIGEHAVARLEKVLKDKRNTSNKRASSLYALGSMRTKAAYKLARNALEDNTEDPIVRKDAAQAIGFLRDSGFVKTLLEVLDKSKTNDAELSQAIVRALGQIADPTAFKSLVPLLSHENEGVRLETVWALGLIRGENVTHILSEVKANDKSSKVREAAENSIKWIKRTTITE